MCEIAFELVGERHGRRPRHRAAVRRRAGRVQRTANRRDFALTPFAPTLLDRLTAAGHPVVAIGKIEDLFAGRGITRAVHTTSDDEGMDEVEAAMTTTPRGLIFANLVDFDTLYGHRNDVAGYAANLERFDARLATLLPRLRPRRSAGRHGRSRQRSDDAEHRSRARVRAGVPRRRAASAPASTSARAQTFADLGQTLAELFGVAAAAARHELPAARSLRSQARTDRRRRRRDSFASSSSSASARSWRRRRPRAPTAAAGCAPEPEDPIRPAFQRDRDRIIHCKAFRRLKHKTQVFFAPTGDHYRTRLTHTLEVSQIARSIAKVLRLQRRADRSDRARPRPRPHAVRPRRRARPQRARPRRVQPLRAEPAHRRRARERPRRA